MDKSVGYVAQTVELLSEAFKAPNVRDETIAQLGILLTEGEDLNEMTRAWQLLSLCLSCFPPSQSLLSHLDNFLRAEEEDTTLAELHRIIYNSDPVLPTMQDIQMMEGKKFYSSKCIAQMYAVK